MPEPIIKTITVACNAAKAFEVFAEKTTSWWPLDTHAVSAGEGEIAKSVSMESHVGGRIYEVNHNNEEILWGTILEYAPAKQLRFTWHPGSSQDKHTEVEITFEEISQSKTKVTLTHSGWENLGDAAEESRKGYDSGWDIVFDQNYKSAIE